MITTAKARQLRAKIEQASISLSDTDALQAIELFPKWSDSHDYSVGDRVRYEGTLYKCLQDHTSQADWTPDKTPALYTEVKEQGQGTKENPIPYNNNMELEEGLYYIQNEVEYYCFRSTGVPVYNNLADLVNIYVNVVEA